MTKEDAEDFLGDYSERLRRCVLSGFTGMRRKYQDSLHLLTTTTKASVCRDLIVAEMKAEFEEDTEVDFLEHSKLTLVRVGGSDQAVLLRVKKFDRNYVSSSINTKRNERFRCQGNLDFPGIAHQLPNLEVGYVLDRTQTEIESVAIVHPNKHGVNWHWPLESTIEIATLDFSHGEESQDSTPSIRVKPSVASERGIKLHDKKRGNDK